MYKIHLKTNDDRIIEIFAYHGDLSYLITFFTGMSVIREFIITDNRTGKQIKNTRVGNLLGKSSKWKNRFSIKKPKQPEQLSLNYRPSKSKVSRQVTASNVK